MFLFRDNLKPKQLLADDDDDDDVACPTKSHSICVPFEQKKENGWNFLENTEQKDDSR